MRERLQEWLRLIRAESYILREWPFCSFSNEPNSRRVNCSAAAKERDSNAFETLLLWII